MTALPVVLITQLALAGPWAEGRGPVMAFVRDLVPARWAAVAVQATVAGDAGSWWLAVACLAGLVVLMLAAALLLLRRSASPASVPVTRSLDAFGNRLATASPPRARLVPVGLAGLLALAAGVGTVGRSGTGGAPRDRGAGGAAVTGPRSRPRPHGPAGGASRGGARAGPRSRPRPGRDSTSQHGRTGPGRRRPWPRHPAADHAAAAADDGARHPADDRGEAAGHGSGSGGDGAEPAGPDRLDPGAGVPALPRPLTAHVPDPVSTSEGCSQKTHRMGEDRGCHADLATRPDPERHGRRRPPHAPGRLLE